MVEQAAPNVKSLRVEHEPGSKPASPPTGLAAERPWTTCQPVARVEERPLGG